MIITLKRIAVTEHGTYGVLINGTSGDPFAVTLELPDRANAQNISSIPLGTYTARRIKSPKFGDTFQVMDVPGRSEILFHGGNYQVHTHGCILVAEKFKDINADGVMDVSESIGIPNEGFLELLAILHAENEFSLDIIES